MIGVVVNPDERPAVEEFFELFKTPWEFFEPGNTYDVVISSEAEAETDAPLVVLLSAGETEQTLSRQGDITLPIYCGSTGETLLWRENAVGSQQVVRLGYHLWREIDFLLRVGQPVEHAHIPTLELHIELLRDVILNAGIELVEVPPIPPDFAFAVSLTHDIDFIGIRQHKFDHTVAGFIYRSTVGALRDCLRGRMRFGKLCRIWKSLASLPLVYLGWKKDFWLPFEWYLRAEKDLPATYYLIPFKRTPGEKVPRANASRRACAYDVGDLLEWTKTLTHNGCEVGVHGIDAWHSVEKGRRELQRVATVTGSTQTGIRMHWLLQDAETPKVLEEAGYEYDSTAGYNETIGYRAGTVQVYLPPGNRRLLELPLHIQDGALFYPQRLGLSEEAAWTRCQELIKLAKKFGGVLTLLWHDRSHGPERFWGEFYERLIAELRGRNVWFASAAQVVAWFRHRRDVRFERCRTSAGAESVCLVHQGEKIEPGLIVRVHQRGNSSDVRWNGNGRLEIANSLSPLPQPAV